MAFGYKTAWNRPLGAFDFIEFRIKHIVQYHSPGLEQLGPPCQGDQDQGKSAVAQGLDFGRDQYPGNSQAGDDIRRGRGQVCRTAELQVPPDASYVQLK